MNSVPADVDRNAQVKFEGPWETEEQDLISSAVEDFEASRSDEALFPTRPSWVCVVYDTGSSSLFCAHRPQLPTVLSATSVGDLAYSIREASEQTGRLSGDTGPLNP